MATDETKTKDDADDAKEQKPSDSGPQVGTRYTAEEIHQNISMAAKEEMERPMGELRHAHQRGLAVDLRGARAAFARLAAPAHGEVVR